MSNIRLKSVEIAAKVVATMEIENKSKALFDLAKQIEEWVGVEQQKQPHWTDAPIYPYGAPIPCIQPPWEVTCTSGTSRTDTLISTTDNTNKE